MKTKNPISIFIVEDDKMLANALDNNIHGEFNQDEIAVTEFETGEICLEHIRENKPQIVILDYFLNSTNLNAINGIEVLKKIKAFSKDIQVIMLSGQDKLEVATNCLKYGAYDYVVKNETAFYRTLNIIKQLKYNNVVKTNMKSYELLNWFLVGALLLVVVLGLVWLYHKGIYFEI